MVTFYPASGYRYSASGALSGTGGGAIYFDSGVKGVNASGLAFYSPTLVEASGSFARAFGFPVRCVQYLQSDLHVTLNRSHSIQVFFIQTF